MTTNIRRLTINLITPPQRQNTRQKIKEFAVGFFWGITAPVSAWATLKRIDIKLSVQSVKSAAKSIRGSSLLEFGKNIGYLALSSLTLSTLVNMGAYFPEVVDYFSSLTHKPWIFWAKKEIFHATTSPEIYRAFSENDILSMSVTSRQYLNYFTPYAIAPVAGAGNEIVREITQKEPLSLWKISYVSIRFLLGTALLVKMGQWTWDMPYLKTLGSELLAWSLYYGAFTIPTAVVRGKTPSEIDTIIRKQVFYSAILTSFGLSALTAFVNPALLDLLGQWGRPESFGYLAPIATRGLWETFITQMVLRAEFGGDEFLTKLFRRPHPPSDP